MTVTDECKLTFGSLDRGHEGGYGGELGIHWPWLEPVPPVETSAGRTHLVWETTSGGKNSCSLCTFSSPLPPLIPTDLDDSLAGVGHL